jgi:preprotein translocase subunit YajC
MFATPAYAQAAGAAAAGDPTTAFLVQLLPFVAIFVLFYFLLIRPQQKRAKQHAAMIGAVKRGDNVVLSGGIHGKVVRVEDADVMVEIAQGVQIRVVKSTIADVRAKGEPLPALTESLDKPAKPARTRAKSNDIVS